MQISRVSQLSLVLALMMMTDNSTFAQRVKTDFDRNTDFTQFTTFMWIKEPSTTNPLMRHRIVDGINRALAVRGLTLVTSDADLAIAAHAATEERTRDTFYNGGGWRGGGWSWFGGFDPDTATGSSPQVGTLVVDVFDARTKTVIWRGTASKTLSDNPRKNADRLNKAVTKMFRKFPPGSKKTN